MAVYHSTPRDVRWPGDPATGSDDDEDFGLRRGGEHGKSLGCDEHTSHLAPKWDADCLLKNRGSLFTRGTEATLVWFDDIEVMLEHMVCPLDL